MGFAVPGPAGRALGRGGRTGGCLATSAAWHRWEALLRLPGGSKLPGSDAEGSASLCRRAGCGKSWALEVCVGSVRGCCLGGGNCARAQQELRCHPVLLSMVMFKHAALQRRVRHLGASPQCPKTRSVGEGHFLEQHEATGAVCFGCLPALLASPRASFQLFPEPCKAPGLVLRVWLWGVKKK